MLISEVTELLIRDHTSRITPAGVSSRGALLLREAEPKAAWMDTHHITPINQLPKKADPFLRERDGSAFLH